MNPMIKNVSLSIVLFMIIFLVDSCSKECFFEYEDEGKEQVEYVDDFKYNYIGKSKEYSDFYNLSLMRSNCIDNDSISEVVIDKLFDEYKKAYNKLIDAFPEYLELSTNEIITLKDNYYEKQQIMYLKRTKGSNPEDIANTRAYKSMHQSNTLPDGITCPNGEIDRYVCGSITIHLYADPGYALSLALDIAEGNPYDSTDNHEVGGYRFSDSSILLIDVYATQNTMHGVSWNFGSFSPKYFFHIHPHYESLPSSLDSNDEQMKTDVISAGCSGFRIYNLNGNHKNY